MRHKASRSTLIGCFIAGGFLLSVRLIGQEPGAGGVDPSEIVTEMLQNRRGIRTAYIEWQRLLPQQRSDPRMRRMISRVAGAHLLLTDLGPEDGPRWLTDKDRLPPADLGPQNSLTRSGLLWIHDELATDATVFESGQTGRAPRTTDPRAFGLAPGDFELEEMGKQLLYYCAQPGATAVLQGDVAVVSFGDGHQRMNLRIDTAKDFNPTQIEVTDPTGRVQGLLKSTLKKYGDRWYPESVSHEMSGPGGLQVSQIIKISRAEFNEPDLPEELAVQDIGVDVGTLVTRKDASGKQIDQRYWDGRELITVADFRRRTADGSLAAAAGRRELWVNECRRTGAALPSPARAARTEGPTVPDWAASLLSDWERQTIDFIRQHRLKSQPADAAVRMLEQAQEHADKYFRRASEDMRLATSQPAAANHDPEIQRAAKERILDRLNRIFERDLKRRLLTILPRPIPK